MTTEQLKSPAEKESPEYAPSPVRLQVIITIAIFCTEVIVMTILYIFPSIPPWLSIFLDALFLLIILVPLLKFTVFDPLVLQIRQREEAEQELHEYRKKLEDLVAMRTSQLTEAITKLERQVEERKEVEVALLESQERFRQLFQQSEDAIILFRRGTTRIVDLNPLVEKLFGFTKQELFNGGPGCFCGGKDLEDLFAAVIGLQGEATFQTDRMPVTTKEGKKLTVSVRGKVVVIQGIDFVYCTFRNITDRIRLEEEARLIQSKMIHANKMTSLGVLVASIAHEINNPNNYILANGEFLAKSYADIRPVLDDYYRDNGDFLIGGMKYSDMADGFGEVFNGIRDGSLRIRDIINNLKALARDERPNPEVRVDLNRVVTLAVNILNHQIKKFTKKFSAALAPDLPLIQGSVQQLEQVVINLIMNAVQALPDSGCAVEVSTLRDGDSVVLRVRDEGTGMPPGVATRILEPFFTTRLDSGGTGLGLAISYSIIKDHNGTLDFESEQGKGTVFTIRFPSAVIPSGEHHG